MSSRLGSPLSRSPSAAGGLLRLLGALACGTFGASLARAQEGAPPAGEPAATDRTRNPDTLDAARDELRRLQAERAAPSPAAGTLPRVAAPEWHGGPAPLKPVTPPRKAPGTDPRRTNWLVDAMQRPAPAAGTGVWRDREETEVEAAEAESTLLPDVRPARTSITRAGKPAEEQGSRERSGQESARKPPAEAANPLTRFLDDWMTPQDYALLGAPRSGNAPTLSLAKGGAALPGDAAVTAPTPLTPRLAEALPGLPAPSTAMARPAARENPFLAVLNTPLPLPSPGPAQAPVVTPPPAAVSPAAPPPAAPAPARVPDFARPSTDEKYFKPLKRF